MTLDAWHVRSCGRAIKAFRNECIDSCAVLLRNIIVLVLVGVAELLTVVVGSQGQSEQCR
jgi:hypothetical protein